MDGKSEPMKPIIAPKMSAEIIRSGVTRKLNAISLKVAQFEVPVDTKFNGRVSKIPSAAPIRATPTDSSKKAIKILVRLKPSTRNVPISFVRRATLAYIVFMPANPAPTAMMKEIKTASPFNAPEAKPCWSS